MLTSDFNFLLPPERIAQQPPSVRGTSRLMVLNRKNQDIIHSSVQELYKFIPSNALMVFNDSKVRRSRLYAHTQNGGKLEILLLEQKTECLWHVISTRMSKLKTGTIIFFEDGVNAKVVASHESEKELMFSRPIDDAWLELHGHIPLPPYITRADTQDDSQRYQTIYAKDTGSAAAATAGLHFTDAIMDSLKQKGIEIQFVTLHVGLGTFMPVRSPNIEAHTMHYEKYSITEASANAINNAKKNNRPILAVGTTSVRTLESAWDAEKIKSGWNKSNIFIYPCYNFNVVDMLFTNFHTPQSTLLMLASAFAGKDYILKAYEKAIEDKYNFFSYGDAMLIL